MSASCPGCSTSHPGLRIYHHLRTVGLKEHMIEQYGPAYEKDGRLEKRLRFVGEVRRIYHDEYKADGRMYSLAEAYNLAAQRLNLPGNKRQKRVGIEASQPPDA